MTITLTRGQDDALSKAFRFLASEDNIFLLSGSAGTGKTLLASQIPVALRRGRVLGTAPTHKAVGVLAGRLPDVECMTIHRFLGLKPKFQGDKTTLIRSKMYDPSEYYDVTVVIVDEASMLDSEIMKYIAQDIDQWGRKYIFIGDRYQLPPVNEKESPCFTLELPDRCKHELTEIMRHSGPIITTATLIRDAIIRGDEPELKQGLSEDGTGVRLLKATQWEAALNSALKKEEFKENPDFCRVVAYRNDTVMQHNQSIRGLLGEPTNVPFCVGDNLVANEAWTQHEEVIFNTGTEFVVEAMEDHTHPIYPELMGWQVWLKGVDGVPVYVLDLLKCRDLLKKKLAQLASAAKQPGGSWHQYYALAEYYADLRVLYSITSHKCLPLDARVTTDNGITPIRDLTLGSLVRTGEGNLKRVTAISPVMNKRVAEVSLLSGRVILSSYDHRFRVADGSYKRASELSQGDYLLLRREEGVPYSEDLDYWAYGYLVGNGCYSYTSNRIDVTLLEDSSVIPKLKAFLGKYGSTVYTYSKRDNKAITLSAELKQLRDELSDVGLSRVTAADKRMCPKMDKKQQVSFLRGLFDADGSCSKTSATVRLVTVSKDLAYSVAALLQEHGIIARIAAGGTKKEVHSTPYTVGIYGPDCARFAECIGFSEEYKQEILLEVVKKVNGKTNTDFIPEFLGVREKLKALLSTHRGKLKQIAPIKAINDAWRMLGHANVSFFQAKTAFDLLIAAGVEVDSEVADILRSHFFYDLVSTVTLKEEELPMMDIEVEGDHNFLVDGVVAHNSQGSTFQNVFVDYRDIYANRNKAEADRCLYVAVTRASKNVFIKY